MKRSLTSAQGSRGSHGPNTRPEPTNPPREDGRLRLGRRLAELRQASGLSQGDVAARIGWDTAGPVFRIEQGLRQRVTRRDLLAYLGAIGSEDPALRGELIDIWREIKR